MFSKIKKTTPKSYNQEERSVNNQNSTDEFNYDLPVETKPDFVQRPGAHFQPTGPSNTTPTAYRRHVNPGIWFGLFLFCIFWAFIVGLFLGQSNYYDRRIDKIVKVYLNDTSTTKASSEQASPTIKNTDNSLLVKTEDRIEEILHIKQPTKKAAEPVASEPPPPPIQEPADDTQPTPKAVVPKTGRYAVQVAALDTEKEAEQLVDSLKDKGLDAFYIHAQVKGRSYYRVQLGHYETMDEAKKTLNKVKEHGHKDAFISDIQSSNT